MPQVPSVDACLKNSRTRATASRSAPPPKQQQPQQQTQADALVAAANELLEKGTKLASDDFEYEDDDDDDDDDNGGTGGDDGEEELGSDDDLDVEAELNRDPIAELHAKQEKARAALNSSTGQAHSSPQAPEDETEPADDDRGGTQHESQGNPSVGSSAKVPRISGFSEERKRGGEVEREVKRSREVEREVKRGQERSRERRMHTNHNQLVLNVCLARVRETFVLSKQAVGDAPWPWQQMWPGPLESCAVQWLCL